MSTRRIPFATLSLLTLMAGLHLLVPDKTALYFSAADIARGEAWRLVTGHLVHADLQHLLWNGLGLGILGWLLERRSGSLLWISLAAGIASVDGLLLSPFSQLQYYCGLSGVLNTLLVVALWLEWAASRSLLAGAVAIGSALKVVLEIHLGVAIMTHISWPSYPWAHLAGLLGGLPIILARHRRSLDQSIPSCPGGSPDASCQCTICQTAYTQPCKKDTTVPLRRKAG